MEKRRTQGAGRRMQEAGCRILEHISWQIGELVQLIRSSEVLGTGVANGYQRVLCGNRKV